MRNTNSAWKLGVAALVVAAAGSGCTNNPGAGSTAYKAGTLGNGGFLFECDDSVACDRWTTNNAKDFPEQVATGSTFSVRFVESSQQGGVVTFDSPKYEGVVSTPVAPYFSSGPNGLTALKPGYGTIMATDRNGAIVDYVAVQIVKPDAIIVYDAAYKGSTPTKLEAVTMATGESKRFRTVGESKREALAGMLQIEWESSDPKVAQVESYLKGVVTIVGKGAGTATLKAVGAASEKSITVEVKP